MTKALFEDNGRQSQEIQQRGNKFPRESKNNAVSLSLGTRINFLPLIPLVSLQLRGVCNTCARDHEPT